MKRATMTALTVACVLGGLTAGPPSNAAEARLADFQGSGQPTQEATRERQCRFQWKDPAPWTAREERLTALCVLDRWSVPGGLAQFQSTIACESGWNRYAYNSAGPYVGLGQHVLSAWQDRVRVYTPPHWTLQPGWFNSRTMLTVTARMMADVGLSPWACA